MTETVLSDQSIRNSISRKTNVNNVQRQFVQTQHLQKQNVQRNTTKDRKSEDSYSGGLTNQSIRAEFNNRSLRNPDETGSNQFSIHQAISNHLNTCYMKYVKGPGTKPKAKKPAEKKEEDGVSEQLVAKQIVNQQDQEQITNNPEENSTVADDEPDQKPDFPKEIN